MHFIDNIPDMSSLVPPEITRYHWIGQFVMFGAPSTRGIIQNCDPRVSEPSSSKRSELSSSSLLIMASYKIERDGWWLNITNIRRPYELCIIYLTGNTSFFSWLQSWVFSEMRVRSALSSNSMSMTCDCFYSH